MTARRLAPSALADRTGVFDLFARFIPSAFYYKTFMWPNWHLLEPRIREMAELGRLASDQFVPGGDQINHFRDLVVVGAGPVGIAAARMLAKSGQSVLLVDDGNRIGGSLLHRQARIDGRAWATWLAQAEADIAALGVQS